MKLFVTVYNDATLLPYFLDHYSHIGIDEFYIAAGPEWQSEIRRFERQYDIVLCGDAPALDDHFYSRTAVADMRHRHQAIGEWVAIVDLDEFIEVPDLGLCAAAAEGDGANVVRGIMHDRFSADGGLPKLEPDADLAAVFPVKSRFIRNVMRGCDHKGVLVRGHLQSPPAAGHHRFDGELLAKQILEISHFKWLEGAVERLRASYRIVAERGIAWAAEYKRALDHYDAHGRFAWEEFGGRFADAFEIEAPLRCLVCGAPVSEAEHDYAVEHFGLPLCRADQASRRAQ